MNLRLYLPSCLMFLTIFPVIASSFLFAQTTDINEKNYKVYSVKQSKTIDIGGIVEDFKYYDVILFGEEHNDAVAHHLQAALLEKLYDRYGNSMVLSLEMFDRDVQVVLDEYLGGCITEDYFIKDARAWNNYNDYRPMIEFAKEHGMYIIAANAPFRYANMARRKGQVSLALLPDIAKNYFAPLPYDTATGVHYEKILAITTAIRAADDIANVKMPGIPATAMPTVNINQGQSLWNATMAFSICEYRGSHEDKKVFHVNGRFHSDEYFGVPQQIRKYNPELKYLVISAFPDSIYPGMDFTQYKDLGDYIIVTNL